MNTNYARKLRRSRAVFAAVNGFGGLVLTSVSRQLEETGLGEPGLVAIGAACGLLLLAMSIIGFFVWFCSEGS